MHQRLTQKGFPPETAAQTIEALRISGFLDDAALAENLKREAFSRKMLSRSGARLYMLGRGVPRHIIDATLSDDEKSDLANAKRIIEKKMKSLKNHEPEIIRRRLYNVLSRKGYASVTIRAALKDNYFCKEEDT